MNIEQWNSWLWIVEEENKKAVCVFDENVASCMFDTILYYWYDSCKVFFKQLNNLLLSMLPQRVPDLDKKLNPSPYLFSFFFFGTLNG